jgi:hypothetical protein
MELKIGPKFPANFIESTNSKRRQLDNAEKGIYILKKMV